MLTTNKTNVNTIAWAKPTHVLLVCNLKISSGVSLFAVSLWTETDPKFSAAPIHVYIPPLFLLFLQLWPYFLHPDQSMISL